jgi:hypothetical protein
MYDIIAQLTASSSRRAASPEILTFIEPLFYVILQRSLSPKALTWVSVNQTLDCL